LSQIFEARCRRTSGTCIIAGPGLKLQVCESHVDKNAIMKFNGPKLQIYEKLEDKKCNFIFYFIFPNIIYDRVTLIYN
jgi:hypothetical protein